MFRTRNEEASRTTVPAVRLEAVSKVYGRVAGAVQALRGISVALPHGSFTAVMGPSGSGRSTLLQAAAFQPFKISRVPEHPAIWGR